MTCNFWTFLGFVTIHYNIFWKIGFLQHIILASVTLSWRRSLLYSNQFIDLQSISMDWFLYDNGLRHEKVKFHLFTTSRLFYSETIFTIPNWAELIVKLLQFTEAVAYGCSFVAKLSWKKIFYFWKIFVFFTKYTLFAEKIVFIWKKSFTLKSFSTEKKLFLERKM